jgi:hypothetical protein
MFSSKAKAYLSGAPFGHSNENTLAYLAGAQFDELRKKIFYNFDSKKSESDNSESNERKN